MHTLCARPVKSTGGSRAEGAPDLAGANRRYSRVRTPAWNTVSAKEGYEEKRKEGTALSPAPASARAHAHPLPDRQRAFRITWQIEDLPPAAPLLRLKPPARKGKRIQSRGPSGDPSKEPHA